MYLFKNSKVSSTFVGRIFHTCLDFFTFFTFVDSCHLYDFYGFVKVCLTMEKFPHINDLLIGNMIVERMEWAQNCQAYTVSRGHHCNWLEVIGQVFPWRPQIRIDRVSCETCETATIDRLCDAFQADRSFCTNSNFYVQDGAPKIAQLPYYHGLIIMAS